jgi:Sulfotransferase family
MVASRSGGDPEAGGRTGGALPNLVVIGAMKCGTSALHRLLDCHPDISMSEPKELNFFFGPDQADGGSWATGNWHRGVAWYARQFDARATVRGESSPGYTSPAHPEAARRMAALVPGARLLYLVRDPVERAVSQYRHHHAEGSERRRLAEALLDPDSQYLARSRYHDRLAPFLAHFERRAIAILCQEELLAEQRRTLRAVFELLQVDGRRWPGAPGAGRGQASDRPPPRPGGRLRERLAAALRDDADRLRELAGRDFPAWSV